MKCCISAFVSSLLYAYWNFLDSSSIMIITFKITLVHNNFEAITTYNEALRVGCDAFYSPSIHGWFWKHSLEFTIVVQENQLASSGTYYNISISQPSMASILLRHLTAYTIDLRVNQLNFAILKSVASEHLIAQTSDKVDIAWIESCLIHVDVGHDLDRINQLGFVPLNVVESNIRLTRLKII